MQVSCVLGEQSWSCSGELPRADHTLLSSSETVDFRLTVTVSLKCRGIISRVRVEVEPWGMYVGVQ